MMDAYFDLKINKVDKTMTEKRLMNFYSKILIRKFSL